MLDKYIHSNIVYLGSKCWRNGRQQLTESAQLDCNGWAGGRFGGPTCTWFLNNTSNYPFRIVTSGSRSGGWSDSVNMQHAGRSFEVVLFCTSGGQTKIQHDTMQNRRTSVLGFTALPLYLRYLEDSLFSVPFWTRYRDAQYLLCQKYSPLTAPSLNLRSTDSSETSVISTYKS